MNLDKLFGDIDIKWIERQVQSTTTSLDVSDPISNILFIAHSQGAVSPGNPCSICRKKIEGVSRAHFHGSEFNACPRKVYYDITNHDANASPSNQAFLLDGHTHEMLVLKSIERGLALIDSPYVVERAANKSEIQMHTPLVRFAIIGHFDGILSLKANPSNKAYRGAVIAAQFFLKTVTKETIKPPKIPTIIKGPTIAGIGLTPDSENG